MCSALLLKKEGYHSIQLSESSLSSYNIRNNIISKWSEGREVGMKMFLLLFGGMP